MDSDSPSLTVICARSWCTDSGLEILIVDQGTRFNGGRDCLRSTNISYQAALQEIFTQIARLASQNNGVIATRADGSPVHQHELVL